MTPDAPREYLKPTSEASGNYLNADFMLHRDGTLSKGRVIEHKHDTNGRPIGKSNDNTILDLRHYLVEFEDGQGTELTANVIAGSIHAMCDPEGEHVLLFDFVVDFKRDRNSTTITEQKFVDSCGKAKNYRSTEEWQLFCQWKNGSTSWEKLYDFNHCYPIHTVNYYILQGIEHGPEFNWWMRHTLKKRERIISLVQKK